MNIIASKAVKAATTISCNHYRWIHAEAWTEQHKVFAAISQNNCESHLIRSAWTRLDRSKLQPPPSYGFIPTSEWILENSTTNEVFAYVKLDWELGIFEKAWLYLVQPSSHNPGTTDPHPLLWLIDFVVNRLSPDVLMLAGDLPSSLCEEFPAKKVMTLDRALRNIVPTKLVEVTGPSWSESLLSKPPQVDLGWVKKAVERERREVSILTNKKPRPFLIRLLMAMSPIRRRRSQKMIHPLTRYKYRP